MKEIEDIKEYIKEIQQVAQLELEYHRRRELKLVEFKHRLIEFENWIRLKEGVKDEEVIGITGDNRHKW